MKTLIIPDIHHKPDWIEEFLSKQKYDSVIFLGDYFDCHDDKANDAYNAIKTAIWLRESLQYDNRIHLLGNHDLSYMFSHNNSMFCPGFTKSKAEAINNFFPKNLWKKLRLYYKIDNFLFSHAGIKNSRVADENNNVNTEWLDWYCKDSLTRALYDKSPFLTDVESIIWLRWWNLPIIDGINQIVGHTIYDEPQVNKQKEIIGGDERNFNVCLDTQSKFYGILEDGRFGYNEVGSDEKNVVWVN